MGRDGCVENGSGGNLLLQKRDQQREPTMDYFAAMRAFARAVDLGSFSKAAAEEGVKVSTVSRYVSALEADLGAALFNRSTRRLHLTEVGASFYEHASRILSEGEEGRLAATSPNAGR